MVELFIVNYYKTTPEKNKLNGKHVNVKIVTAFAACLPSFNDLIKNNTNTNINFKNPEFFDYLLIEQKKS